MRKPEKSPLAGKMPALLAAVAMALLSAAVAPAPAAHELKDVSLITAGGQTHLKLSFSPKESEGDYPLFFQKSDMDKGTITLSFLETETAFPLGRHSLEAGSPELEVIILKKITSPSGKNFLGVELKLRQAPGGDVSVQPVPKGVLKVVLGKGKGKYSWSLTKAMKAEDSYLTAKAEPPPKGNASASPGTPLQRAGSEAIGREEAMRAEPVMPSLPVEPTIPGKASAEPSAPAADIAAPESAPATVLTEVKLMVTAAQEDLILVFNPPGAPKPSPRTDPNDPLWLELTLEGATSGLAKKEYSLPKSSVFKRFKTVKKGSGLMLRIQLATREAVQIAPHESGLALSGLGKGEAAPAFKWTSAKPEGLLSENVADNSPDGVKSAHQEGQKLESGHGAKGLSSSRIFSIAGGGKTMVLLKDSASLKTVPGAKGMLIRKIPVGERIEKIDAQGSSLRVVSGQDTGWIKAIDAVYDDELTKAQEKTIQSIIEAKQARLTTAQKKLEAKAAKAEAAALKKIEAEALAVQKKADAEALAIQKKADAEALAAQKKADAETAKLAKEKAKAIAQQEKAMQLQEARAAPKLAIADNPELAAKLAQEKLAAEDEKKRVEPEENRIAYNSYGRRDPFIPVEQGAADNGIDIDQMKVVGIIWQASQQMAVLEHNRESGVSFTVKEGDPVHNGRVSRISRDAVTFDISEYGISRSYSLKLVTSREGVRK
ncbi:MAG: cell envelope integrity protein TolA [Fibrobacterota bacterium]|nr:cell envelope integrity protein TolA [Fibrobacterota bacterium]